ncbi:MAG: hypothetical protein E7536_08175 [Ruminococcaceae bacterium]|nr:hypothetical protein [Oscillospiraceae bacterium]
MKTPRIVNAIGHIDDDLINSATKSKKVSKKNIWIKWTSLAASFALIIFVSAVVVPTLFGDGNVSLPIGVGETTVNDEITNSIIDNNSPVTSPTENKYTQHIDNEKPTDVVNDNTTTAANNDSTTKPVTGHEAVWSEAYFYNVSDGVFSTYILCGKVISEDKIGSKIDDVSVSAGWKNNANEWLTTETLRAEVYLINDISKDVAVALKFIDKGDALTTTHYYVIMNPDADLTPVKDYLIRPLEPSNTGDEIAGNEISEEYVVEYTTQFVNE